jgi:hypothetical protein
MAARLRYERSKEETLSQLAGSALSAMQRLSAAESYLSHEDTNLRLASLFVISDRWRDNESFIQKCQELAVNDPDQTVRGVALWVIAELFRAQQLTQLVKSFKTRYQINDISQLQNTVASWQEAMHELRERVYYGNAPWQHKCEALSHSPDYSQLIGKSLESLEVLLSHSDPKLRLGGVTLLSEYHGATAEFLDQFENLVLTDSDDAVRMAALSALIDHFSRTQDQHFERVLADIVGDDSLSLIFRDVAYQGLFRVHRLPVEDWPEVKRATGHFEFPQDVDWALVNVFRGGESKTGENNLWYF